MAGRGSRHRRWLLWTLIPIVVVVVASFVWRDEIERQLFKSKHSENNLRNIGLAITHFAVDEKNYPGDIFDPKGKPLLIWRVTILPYMNRDGLYERFKIDEPWDSEHNKGLLKEMPEVFVSPFSDLTDEGKTVYLRPVGRGFVFDQHKSKGLRDLSDGASYTIIALEATDACAVPWTKPEDLTVDLDSPLAGLGVESRESFAVVFADGRVIQLKTNTKPDVWFQLMIGDHRVSSPVVLDDRDFAN